MDGALLVSVFIGLPLCFTVAQAVTPPLPLRLCGHGCTRWSAGVHLASPRDAISVLPRMCSDRTHPSPETQKSGYKHTQSNYLYSRKLKETFTSLNYEGLKEKSSPKNENFSFQEFVSSSEQKFDITCSPPDHLKWMGAVRIRVLTADKNLTIIHTTPVHQLMPC